MLCGAHVLSMLSTAYSTAYFCTVSIRYVSRVHLQVGHGSFVLHNGEPCSFGTCLCISMAMHVTAGGVRVITIKRHTRFRSVRG